MVFMLEIIMKPAFYADLWQQYSRASSSADRTADKGVATTVTATTRRVSTVWSDRYQQIKPYFSHQMMMRVVDSYR